jgi:hypothetical protein
MLLLEVAIRRVVAGRTGRGEGHASLGGPGLVRVVTGSALAVLDRGVHDSRGEGFLHRAVTGEAQVRTRHAQQTLSLLNRMRIVTCRALPRAIAWRVIAPRLRRLAVGSRAQLRLRRHQQPALLPLCG